LILGVNWGLVCYAVHVIRGILGIIRGILGIIRGILGIIRGILGIIRGILDIIRGAVLPKSAAVPPMSVWESTWSPNGRSNPGVEIGPVCIGFRPIRVRVRTVRRRHANGGLGIGFRMGLKWGGN